MKRKGKPKMAKFKIPASGYYFDWQTYIFHMTFRFSVKANDMSSKEFAVYEEFAKRYPTMKVMVEAPKKHKSPYLTYDRMGAYIACQDNAAELMAQLHKVIEEARGQKNPRKFVDDWFRKTFPDFGKYPQKAAS